MCVLGNIWRGRCDVPGETLPLFVQYHVKANNRESTRLCNTEDYISRLDAQIVDLDQVSGHGNTEISAKYKNNLVYWKSYIASLYFCVMMWGDSV